MRGGSRAELVLEDGSTFPGEIFGHVGSIAGEVVFNTGMVGYAEAMTDPSYAGQILVFTYPLIGNYGVPTSGEGNKRKTDTGLNPSYESSRIWVQGIIVSSLASEYSHWSAKSGLESWMKDQNIPGISGIDTRALTKRLREKGTMLGKIVTGDNDVPWMDPNVKNIVAEVSLTAPEWIRGKGSARCVLVDLGAKHNIIRRLNARGIDVLRVPWNYDWTSEEADGVIISNGPGDPKMCADAVRILRKGMEQEKPIFGICLGNQLMALAAGGDTYKLKYGHRSQNQPCIEVGTQRCYITTQNHGFAVAEESLPSDWAPWFFNANDGTNEGIRHRTLPFFSVQFHPEATPGPTDTDHLFDHFLRTLSHARPIS